MNNLWYTALLVFVVYFFIVMNKIFRLLTGLFLLITLGLSHANSNINAIEQTLEDSIITTKITAKFTKNRELNPLKISVTTHQGNVILKGHVGTKEAFIEALTLTKATNGVQSVNIEDLTIKQVNTSLTDAYITAKVETAVLKAKVFDDESIPLVGINAQTVNGVVTLSGNVPDEKSLFAIIKQVNKVNGVKKIISQLEIKKEI